MEGGVGEVRALAKNFGHWHFQVQGGRLLRPWCKTCMPQLDEPLYLWCPDSINHGGRECQPTARLRWISAYFNVCMYLGFVTIIPCKSFEAPKAIAVAILRDGSAFFAKTLHARAPPKPVQTGHSGRERGILRNSAKAVRENL